MMRTDIDICLCGHLRRDHGSDQGECMECAEGECLEFQFDARHPDNLADDGG